MTDAIPFTIDGEAVRGRPGQTILEAAQDNGIYIERLCYKEGLTAYGSCRLCTVMVGGRATAACTSPIRENMAVENRSDRVLEYRRSIIDMLFVEGNHFCMFCEKSGNCELQAVAYRFRITVPKFPYQFPQRNVDASHPDILIDHNRCILCARCIRASEEVDGKQVFRFVGRGPSKRLGVNGKELADTTAEATDAAIDACPVGALLRKREGYRVPIGRRLYDQRPIGSAVEDRRKEAE